MGPTLGLRSELGYSYDANAELVNNALNSDFGDFCMCSLSQALVSDQWSAYLPLMSVNGLLAAVKPCRHERALLPQ